MASTVLPNGIIVPEKFSRDWYADLYHNWQELDNLLGGGTPKDGTLTIQKNGDTVGTFSANQATDETINITVPDVNNGTLTIQQNGTTVDTFTANSSSDKTVNIEVPTKTSDLNNDSGFITGVSWNDVADKPSFATVATSGSYNDLGNKPTIPTVNNGTLTIQQNGTTVDTFTANSSSDKTVNIECVDLTNNQTVAGNKEFTGTTTAHDLVPSATDTYNFGSSTAQWNNAYIKSLTINGVACGDILTHNASEFAYDTNVVHKSGNETIKGNKYFNGNYVDVIGYRFRIKNTVEVAGELPTAENPWTGNRWNGFNFVDKNNVRTFEIARGAMSNGWTFLNFGILNNASNTWLEFLKYEGNSSVSYVSSIDFFPMSNDTYELGSSANKWKSFNGINPGALSLPGTSVNVDTTNWVLDGSNVNIFTPASDGWLGIQATDTVYDQMHYVFVGRTGGGSAYYQQNITSPINALWDSKYRGCIFIPVVKNYNYDIRCICSTIVATFYPCQGNV